MSKESLKFLRIMIPGLIAILFVLPIIYSMTNSFIFLSPFSLFTFENILYLVPALFIGAVYNILGFRNHILQNSEIQIRDNIMSQIIYPFHKTYPKFKMIDSDIGLMDIFYYFVDKDESLRERAKHVYINGLYMSTCADVIAFSLFFSLVYIIFFLFHDDYMYLYYALSACFFLILSLLLLIRITSRHIELGNNQIEYIMLHYKEAVLEKLKNLINLRQSN